MVDHLQRRWRRANQLCRRSTHGHPAAAITARGLSVSTAGRLPPGASLWRRRRQRNDDGHLRSTVVVVNVVVVAVFLGAVLSSAAAVAAAAAAAGQRRDAYEPHRQLPTADHVAGRHPGAFLKPRRHRVVQTHQRQIHRYHRPSFLPSFLRKTAY